MSAPWQLIERLMGEISFRFFEIHFQTSEPHETLHLRAARLQNGSEKPQLCTRPDSKAVLPNILAA